MAGSPGSPGALVPVGLHELQHEPDRIAPAVAHDAVEVALDGRGWRRQPVLPEPSPDLALALERRLLPPETFGHRLHGQPRRVIGCVLLLMRQHRRPLPQAVPVQPRINRDETRAGCMRPARRARARPCRS